MTAGLVLTSVSKRFGGLQALDSVDFTAAPGEVHALLGQNGSGKSTLVKIITGVHAPEPGASMELWGRRVALPLAAPHEHGIAVIHQDLGLAEQMSVVENIGVTSSFGTRLLAPLSMRRERAVCLRLLADLGLHVSPDTLIVNLSPAERATVAIARATRILQEHTEQFVFVLDEPTTYLSAEEAARVVRLMRSVADRGSAVVFISHRLQEVLNVADRITVFRDGRVADTFRADEGDHDRVLRAMLGRRLAQSYPEPAEPQGAQPDAVLVVSGLRGRVLDNLSFAARPGEIIGFAGLVSMGHDEVPYLVAQAQVPRAGRVVFRDVDLSRRSPGEVIDLGISLVPGNRQRDGAWPEATVRENLALLGNRRMGALSRLRLGAERRRAAASMERFGVVPPEPDRRVDQFSGGNQQKVVLAKWMAHDPPVLVLDEPTQGIDAGAKFDVLQMICRAAADGSVVLIASGDYEQLAHVCHRVLVFRFGRVVAELAGDRISEASIAAAAQAGELPAA